MIGFYIKKGAFKQIIMAVLYSNSLLVLCLTMTFRVQPPFFHDHIFKMCTLAENYRQALKC